MRPSPFNCTGIDKSSYAPLYILDNLPCSSLHFSSGSRKQAQDSCSKAPLWSEKRSHSYGLSEEQACGHEDQPEP